MPPHRSYHQSKEASTKRPCKYCGNLDLPRGIISHEKSCIKALLDKKEQEKHSKIYIRNLRRARIAREAAAGAAVALACAGFSGSAATVMPEPPMKPSAGRSQPNPGSPTTFAPYKDDILTVTGMINSHVEDEEKKIQKAMTTGLGTGSGKIFPAVRARQMALAVNISTSSMQGARKVGEVGQKKNYLSWGKVLDLAKEV